MLRVMLEYTDRMQDGRNVFRTLAMRNVEILKTRGGRFISPQITIRIKDNDELNQLIYALNRNCIYEVRVVKVKSDKTISDLLKKIFKWHCNLRFIGKSRIHKERNAIEKYYNQNGELAVLISPEFGVGWSTWSDKRIAYDKRVVEYWLNESPTSDAMKEFLESIGYSNTYMGGYSSLTIRYIPKGTMFCIHEHDGSESIETPETMCMMVS